MLELRVLTRELLSENLGNGTMNKSDNTWIEEVGEEEGVVWLLGRGVGKRHTWCSRLAINSGLSLYLSVSGQYLIITSRVRSLYLFSHRPARTSSIALFHATPSSNLCWTCEIKNLSLPLYLSIFQTVHCKWTTTTHAPIDYLTFTSIRCQTLT